MSTARKILWNTVSQILAKGVMAVLSIVIVKMITNYLGKVGYGEYSVTFDFLTFFTIVADLGLYTIGVREMAKDESKTEMIMGNILTIRTIGTMIMIVIGAAAAFFVPSYQNTHIPLAICIAAAAMLFNVLTTTISAVLQVHLKMEYNALGAVVGKFITVAYMVFVIYALNVGTTQGLYQLVWGGVAGNFATLAVTYYYSSKLTKLRYRFDWDFWKDVIAKSLPYGIALILNNAYFRIGNILLSIMKSPTDAGIYGLPMDILEAIGIIPLYFMNSVLPVLTKSLERKDGSHQKIIQFAFDFLVMGSMPLIAGTVALAYPIVYLISSPEFLSNLSAGFYGSDVVLQILVFAWLFSFLNSLFGFILVADNRQMQILTRNAIGAGLTILLDVLLIPLWSVRAAAAVNIITECYVAFASYLIAKKYIKFKIKLGTTFKIVISSVVMFLIVNYLRDWSFPYIQNKNIFVLIPLGAIIYGAMLLLTRAITPEMINILRKPKPLSAEEQKVIPEIEDFDQF